MRMYNKDKPNKFRIDYFLMCCGTCNAGLYMDVYQGKNVKNIDIPSELQKYPTTQKAVLVACHKLKFHANTSGGYRHMAMDNRYTSPELVKLLRTKYKCLATRTCRTNRKGFPKSLRMKNSVARGSYKMMYDEVSLTLLCFLSYTS